MMESSFFSSSENLYKYLVSMGLLLIVLTIYYPLKEKQELQIISIQLESEAKALSYKIKNNQKNVKILTENIRINGKTEKTNKLISKLDKLNNANYIEQIETEKKYSEIEIREKYIHMYNWLFWIFFPFGVILTLFGFTRWYFSKKEDDKITKLENKKLELEIEKLRKDV